MNSTKDVYVETAAFRQTLEMIDNRLVVITGPEKSGKSCIGHAILRHYHEKGFQPLIVKTFPEFREYVCESREQVVFFDHIFGRSVNDFRSEDVKTWLESLSAVTKSVARGTCKALFTINSNVFPRVLQMPVRLVENNGVIDMVKMPELTDEEKKQMLDKHWNRKHAGQPPCDEVGLVLRQKTSGVLFPYQCSLYADKSDVKVFKGNQMADRCDMSGSKVTLHLSPSMTQQDSQDSVSFPLYEQYWALRTVHAYFEDYRTRMHIRKTSESSKNMTDVELHQQVGKEFRETELHTACRRGDVEKVKTLLRDGGDLNVKASRGITPLHVASYEGQAGVVEVLLDHNASKTATDTEGWSPLHFASLQGHRAVVEMLLKHEDHSTSAEDEIAFGNQHLIIDCQYKHTCLVKKLRSCLKRSKDPEQISLCSNCCDRKYHHVIENLHRHSEYVNKGTNDGNKTALYLASERGHTAVVEILLKNGACTDVTDIKDLKSNVEAMEARQHQQAALAQRGQNRYTSGMWRASSEHNLQQTAQSRRPTQRRWRYQWTALHAACSLGHEEVVRLLLKYLPSARQTTMHVACYNGRRSVVGLLRDYGVRTNVTDKDNNLPLHVACRAQLAEKAELDDQNTIRDWLADVIETLVKSDTKDIHQTDGEGRTPLLLACQFGSGKAVRCLLDHGARLEQGLVMIACRRGDGDSVKALLEYGAPDYERNTARRRDGQDFPLYVACSKGFADVVDTFIDFGLPADYINKDCETLLHVAIKLEEKSCGEDAIVRIVKRLVKTKSIDINAGDFRGWTPLHVACEHELPDVIALLLREGASADTMDIFGYTPLHRVCEKNLTRLMKQNAGILCGEDNSNPSVSTGRGGSSLSALEIMLVYMAERKIRTPSLQELSKKISNTGRLLQILPPSAAALHVACQYSCEGVVDRVLGDDVNTTDDNRTTPLLAAVRAMRQSAKIVRTLLENQAQVNSRNNQGVTVLQAYVDNTQRDSQVFKLLLQHGVDLRQPDRQGNTFLHHAHMLRDDEIQELGDSGLLTSDIVNACNEDGDTPLHVACRASSLKAAEMLVAAGASAKSRIRGGESPESIAKEQKNEMLLELFASDDDSAAEAGSVDSRASNSGTASDGGEATDERTVSTAGPQSYNSPTVSPTHSPSHSPTQVPQSDALVGCELDEAQLPLHVACRDGNENLVFKLLEGGTATDSVCGRNRTPLHYASEGGHSIAVHYLLTHGANPTPADGGGTTALHLACVGGHVTAASLLVKSGAQADAADDDGNTPLHLGARGGYTDVCLLLIHQGASLHRADRLGRTAVDLVEEQNRALRVLLLNEMDRAGQTDKGHDGCGSVGGTEQSSAGSSAQ